MLFLGACLPLAALDASQHTGKSAFPGRGAPKALVIMLDGMRADTVDNGLAPNLKALADGKWRPGYRGAWSLGANTLRDGTTESAPNHVAIATGMTTKKTGIDDNGDLVRRGTATEKLPTWLARLKSSTPNSQLPTPNALKLLHIFAWYGDLRLSPDYGVQFIFDRDKANAKTLAKMMGDADAPDAVMWYIDLPDHAGHGHGYYPYSKQYMDAVRESDKYVGEVLSAIAARPTFAEEDWLVVVTADHGGWERSHGQMSTQCYTIPFIMAGRRVQQGRIPGVPHNYDAAPTALAHFGVDVSKIDFDGKVRGGEVAAVPKTRALGDGLAVYLPFSDGAVVNKCSSGVAAELCGKAAPIADGAAGGGLRVSSSTNSAGGVCLKGSEKLKFENGADFGFAVWVRTFGPQIGDPVVFGNKNWSGGSNPGVLLTASRGVDMSRVCHAHYDVKKRGKSPGFMFNCGRAGKRREDLGVYNPDFGQWTFYAATRGADGVVRFYQGRRDGYLYCVADDLSDIAFDTGMPFCIGQDGRGVAEYTFVGDVDEFAIWTRTLAHDEVRRIFEAGLAGKGLPE
ncbi:MAG: alkaline phosphatase family protein [Kiritimatiellae bacterium]|nr:alkaline phosphatase family protein [Kiritimatiellia bacterium]